VSPRYNTSTYCRHKELARFLRYNPPQSGRTIQIQLDPSATLPLPQSLAVSFASGEGLLNAGSDVRPDLFFLRLLFGYRTFAYASNGIV
jgi:hypothetical protein